MDPTTDPTPDPTASPTKSYSFPATKEEFNRNFPSETIIPIDCKMMPVLSNQSNTINNVVSYYSFNITDKTYPPIIISTCPMDDNVQDNINYGFDSHIFILQEFDDGNLIILRESRVAACDSISAEVDVSDLKNGQYFAVIQGEETKYGNFSVSMMCKSPPPKVPQNVVMG
eukprot:154613_1